LRPHQPSRPASRIRRGQGNTVLLKQTDCRRGSVNPFCTYCPPPYPLVSLLTAAYPHASPPFSLLFCGSARVC
jgi:hypothetical protein